MRELEIVHPAGKLLVMASQAQEAEVKRVGAIWKTQKIADSTDIQMGDATNTVIILGGELLKKSENLLILGLHPSEIIKGYELALAKAQSELERVLLSISAVTSFLNDNFLYSELSMTSLPSPLTQASLASALRPAIASKQYGNEDLLSELVAEAALAVMPPNPKNFNVDNVRVVKIMGSSLSTSRVVQGMVFGREPEGMSHPLIALSINLTCVPGMIKSATRAKVAVFTCALDISQTETKGTVLIKNADEMLNFTTGEEKLLEQASNETDATNISRI